MKKLKNIFFYKTPSWVVVYIFYFIGIIVIYNLLPWGVIYNKTESVPVGMYLCDFRPNKHEANEIVLFPFSCGEGCQYKGKFSGGEGIRFIKYVLAEPGQDICRRGDEVLLPDGSKQKLYPDKVKPFLQKGECVKVPPGHFYVGSHVDKAFDSRYFGFIKEKLIEAECKHVF